MDSNPGRVNTKPVIFKLVFAASPAKQVALRTNVDIKVGAQDAFLEQPSSGTLRVKRLKRQIIYAEGHKHDCQYRLWSSMSDGGEPY
jgi:hypothetical protein